MFTPEITKSWQANTSDLQLCSNIQPGEDYPASVLKDTFEQLKQFTPLKELEGGRRTHVIKHTGVDFQAITTALGAQSTISTDAINQRIKALNGQMHDPESIRIKDFERLLISLETLKKMLLAKQREGRDQQKIADNLKEVARLISLLQGFVPKVTLELVDEFRRQKMVFETNCTKPNMENLSLADKSLRDMQSIRATYSNISILKPSLTEMDTFITHAQAQLAQLRIEIQSENSAIASAFPLCVTKYKWLKPKEGGAQSPGPYGGWYSVTVGTETKKVFIKQETQSNGRPRPAVVMAEAIGGSIARYLVEEEAAQVYLVRTDNRTEPDETGEKIYLASVEIEGFHDDFWKYAYSQKGLTVPKDRPRVVWDDNHPIPSAMKGFDKRQFARIMAPSLLVGDYDLHGGNIAVANSFGKKVLRRLDFGWALYQLEDEVHPHSRMYHMIGYGPTNHFRDFPRDMRVSEEMAEEIEKIVKKVKEPAFLSEAIDKPVDEAARLYGIEPLRSFAQRIGLKNYDQYSDKDGLVNNIKSYLERKMLVRAKSLGQFACEIRTDLAIEKATNQFRVDPDKLKLVNKEYRIQRLFDGKFHFRQIEHKGSNFVDRYVTGGTQVELKNLMFAAIKEDLKLDKDFNPSDPKTVEEYEKSRELLCRVDDEAWREQWQEHIRNRLLKNIKDNPDECQKYHQKKRELTLREELSGQISNDVMREALVRYILSEALTDRAFDIEQLVDSVNQLFPENKSIPLSDIPDVKQKLSEWLSAASPLSQLNKYLIAGIVENNIPSLEEKFHEWTDKIAKIQETTSGLNTKELSDDEKKAFYMDTLRPLLIDLNLISAEVDCCAEYLKEASEPLLEHPDEAVRRQYLRFERELKILSEIIVANDKTLMAMATEFKQKYPELTDVRELVKMADVSITPNLPVKHAVKEITYVLLDSDSTKFVPQFNEAVSLEDKVHFRITKTSIESNIPKQMPTKDETLRLLAKNMVDKAIQEYGARSKEDLKLSGGGKLLEYARSYAKTAAYTKSARPLPGYHGPSRPSSVSAAASAA